MNLKHALYGLGFVGVLLLTSGVQAVSTGPVTTANSVTGEFANDNVGGIQTNPVVLPSGNLVVPTPAWNGGRGAVACLTPEEYKNGGITVNATNSLIGDSAGDNVGSYGVVVLPNGNYVVKSPHWDNGTATNAGAFTWVNGTTCIPYNETSRAAVVSASNSVVGTTASDGVGTQIWYQGNYPGDMNVLSNGNFVVGIPDWDDGSIVNAGAAMWVNGTVGANGVISAANALIGTQANDQVGLDVYALKNGNYVVNSYNWNNGSLQHVGAVTWGNGLTGITGTINATNSLVGQNAGDRVGWDRIQPLTNSNYVIVSNMIDPDAPGTTIRLVTWADGSTDLVGGLSKTNSLVTGAITANDSYIGKPRVEALPNGNYVVTTYDWDNGSVANVGAVTWMDGTIPASGVVSAANSLIGSTANDYVGTDLTTANSAIVPLRNGHYVVVTPQWGGNRGAVTWADGTQTTSAVVSETNSLVGSQTGDQVGAGDGVKALTNGNYVVASVLWDNNTITDVGAVTWASGTTGLAGTINTSNSLVGISQGDKVGGLTDAPYIMARLVPLENGNYIVGSPDWDNGTAVDAGAATWGDGTTGITGPVTTANSLVGTTTSDHVGRYPKALKNGNYIIGSPDWDNSSVHDAGAVTWGDGTTGITGSVTTANSLIGGVGGDPLPNGHYVVIGSGLIQNAGAVAWGNGITGTTGVISSQNALVGSTPNDWIGIFGVVVLENSDYIVMSPYWDKGSLVNAGAVTYVHVDAPESTLKVELSTATTSAAEGNATVNTVSGITLLVSGGISTTPRTVEVSLSPITANSGLDYSQTQAQVTIPAGNYTLPTPVSIPVSTLGIVGDAIVEDDETFSLTLQNPSSQLEIADANRDSTTINSAVYTIQNDDTAAVTIADVQASEGSSGTSTLTFTAQLVGAVQDGFSVTTAVADGTATAADNDYSFVPSTLTFNGSANETKLFTVTINGDTRIEPDETLTVSLHSPSRASIDVTDTATGTLVDDDKAAVTIEDVSLSEGNTGSAIMTFTATLSQDVPGGFTVQTNVADGTADSDDYSFTPSILTFSGMGGETQTFDVTIFGDEIPESDETLIVSLNSASSALVVTTDQAIGTILNDDTPLFMWQPLPEIPNSVLSYELQVATSPTFAPASLVLEQTLNVPWLKQPAIGADGVKYWRTRGKYVVSATGETIYTPYSEVRSFTLDTTPPAVPALTTPVASFVSSTRTPAFSWAASVGAVQYRLELSQGSVFSTVDLSFVGITGTSFVIPNASSLANGLYVWRLVAVDAAGNTAVSAERLISVQAP